MEKHAILMESPERLVILMTKPITWKVLLPKFKVEMKPEKLEFDINCSQWSKAWKIKARALRNRPVFVFFKCGSWWEKKIFFCCHWTFFCPFHDFRLFLVAWDAVSKWKQRFQGSSSSSANIRAETSRFFRALSLFGNLIWVLASGIKAIIS